MNLRHDTLRRDVALFRKGFLEGHAPDCMCFMMSAALEGYLNFTHFPCRMVEGACLGNHHWWIELEDGTVVDATASQFSHANGRPLPEVYVGSRREWYVPL